MPQYAYFRKQFIPLSEAKINVMTNFMHYGTGVFEGIRGNWNEDRKQIYIFRLKEHFERLLNGCKMLMIDIPYTVERERVHPAGSL
jgi:branched-chain amino acid aminotransferase